MAADHVVIFRDIEGAGVPHADTTPRSSASKGNR